MAKKILVTGGAGFIGSHTVVELIKSGYSPVIIDNFSNSFLFVLDQIKKITNVSVPYYKFDCSSFEEYEKVFTEHADIEGVIHFAAFKAVGESVEDSLRYYQNNVVSLISLLRNMEKFKVSKLVFSSSCTVYGNPEKLPVTEQTPVAKPFSPYGNTKKICEEILQDCVLSNKFNIKVVALRYFNPIGAHESALIGELPIGKPNNLVPFITQTAIGIRECLTVFGGDYETEDGSCVRDYLDVVDLANAHVKSISFLESKSESFYDVFNIGTGQGNSVFEIIRVFEEVNNIKVNYKVGTRRDGDVTAIFADTTKSNQILNWKTEISLAESLKNAWKWQQYITKNLDELSKN